MGGSGSTCKAGSLNGVSAPGGGGEQRQVREQRLNEAIEGITSGELPNVTLSSQGLEPKDIEQLCEALVGNEVVKAVELDGNRVGDAGASRLGKILAANGAIRFLDLTQNGIRDAGAQALAGGLEGNGAMYHLDLTRNRIGSAGSDALGKMLCANGTLRQLSLSENKVGHEGVRALGMAVKAHPSLRILSLRKCGLGAEGSRLLAEGLDHQNATLTELSVGLNNIQDNGARAFAKVVKANNSLKELYMDENSIKDPGGIAIAESLKHNDVLQTLWMVRNDLATDTVAKFAEAISDNRTLRRLGITSKHALPPHVKDAMAAARTKRHDGDRRRGPMPALPPRMGVPLPDPGSQDGPAAPRGGGDQGAPPASEGVPRARDDRGPDDDDDDDLGDDIDELAEGPRGRRPMTSRAQKEGVSRSRWVQEIMLMDDQLEIEELQREQTNQSTTKFAPMDLSF